MTPEPKHVKNPMSSSGDPEKDVFSISLGVIVQSSKLSICGQK